MNGEEADLRRRVLGEWATFLQQELPEMRRFAERRGRTYGLAAGCGEDLVGEMTTTLVSKWEQLAVIIDDDARRRYAYGVLKNMLLKAMDRERRPPRVPLPDEDLLAADVRRIVDVADRYVNDEAGVAYRAVVQERHHVVLEFGSIPGRARSLRYSPPMFCGRRPSTDRLLIWADGGQWAVARRSVSGRTSVVTHLSAAHHGAFVLNELMQTYSELAMSPTAVLC